LLFASMFLGARKRQDLTPIPSDPDTEFLTCSAFIGG